MKSTEKHEEQQVFLENYTCIFINALSIETSYISCVLLFLTQHVLQASLLLIF